VAAKKGTKNGSASRPKKRGRRQARAALPKKYEPTAQEDFMNPVQREYFRQKLLGWRRDILADSSQTISNLREETGQEADIGDRASTEAGRLIELRSRDRARKLLSKIESALQRIEDGTYGYCEDTGEPIGVNRLEARPVATLSVAAQERHERMEKSYNDD
jgi:DnaK suppressor protein